MNSYTTLQWAAIDAVSRDRLTLASRVSPVLTIAGQEITRYEECTYGGDDGLATSFSAVALGRLPLAFEQEECRIDWVLSPPGMAPVRMPGFVGKVIALDRTGGFTAIEAYTAGYEADRQPIGESSADDVTLSGARPDYALYTLLKALPYAGLEIGPFPTPNINRSGDDRFRWWRYALECAQDVAGEAEIALADTPLNYARAYPLSPVAKDTPPEWEFAEPVDADYGGVSDETAGNSDAGEKYARIIGFRESTDLKLSERRIDNRDHRVNPKSAFIMPFSADDTVSAYEQVASKADALGRDDRKVTVAANYPGFWLSRGSVVGASARDLSGELTEGVTLLSSFLYRASSVQVDVSGMRSTIAGTGPVLAEVEVPVEDRRVKTFGGFRKPLIGNAPEGGKYFSSELGWVSYDPEEGLMFYPERSAPYIVTYDPQEGILING